MAKPISTWWERCAAVCALTALAASMLTSHVSCGQDLDFAGQFPTGTIVTSPTPTETPDPNPAG
jgi:hypothetical protein